MEAGRNSRIKTHRELHSSNFQCFCCLHVRTGTIALGLLHVMMQMAIVAVLATALLNPELLTDRNSKTTLMETVDLDQGRLEIRRSTFGQLSSAMRASPEGLYFELLQSTLLGFASLLLMYGAIWGQPSYLMPFFAIMCFDFANALLRPIGSFAKRHTSPHDVDDPPKSFYIMITVILKAYLLNMVWSCYKFLRLRQELIRSPPAPVMTGQTSVTPRSSAGGQAPVEASVLLPDYETTQKQHPYSFYPAPPPPYATAMQMPTVDQLVAPPPSYQDVAGTSGYSGGQAVVLPPEPGTSSSSSSSSASAAATAATRTVGIDMISAIAGASTSAGEEADSRTSAVHASARTNNNVSSGSAAGVAASGAPAENANGDDAQPNSTQQQQQQSATAEMRADDDSTVTVSIDNNADQHAATTANAAKNTGVDKS